MIAVDTNSRVQAHRRDSAWHGPAAAALVRLAENRAGWALPWPCVMTSAREDSEFPVLWPLPETSQHQIRWDKVIFDRLEHGTR